MGSDAEAMRQLGVGEERLERYPEGIQVGGILEQDPALAVHHLVLDPAQPAGDDRSRFPHRLSDRQPEALGKAFRTMTSERR